MENYQVKLNAPAKINYILEIGKKRDDGYHNINTVFQTVSLYDVLYFKEAKDIIVQSDSDKIGPAESNLVYRAADILRRFLKVNKGAQIFLQKNIPVGAGLGGGSSDAACALKGLARLWNLKFKKEDFYKYAAQLGADVSFFIEGGMAIGKGKGEKISPISKGVKPHLPVVIVAPDFQVSSAWAYQTWDEKGKVSKGEGLDKFMSALYRYDVQGITSNLFNDFETVVMEEHPKIREIKERLLKYGASGALMSGSGSAVFGLFLDDKKAAEAAENLADTGKVFKVYTI